MSVISEDYRALNAQHHLEAQEWGLQSIKHWRTVKAFCEDAGIDAVLDYGCGKRALERALAPFGIRVTNYDPAFPELAAPPKPQALVVCTDVLEHVEPECLDSVLKDLRRCTKLMAYFVIATRASLRNMPDGTNPHRIVESKDWWLEKLDPYFKIHSHGPVGEKEFHLFVLPK